MILTHGNYMTYASRLIHRAVLQRSAAIADPTTSQGPTGQPIADWTDPGNVNERDVECRLVEKSERVATSTGLQVFKTYTLFLLPEVDVKNEDRVLQVEMEDGEIKGPFEIETVYPHRDGREKRLITLSLKKVK